MEALGTLSAGIAHEFNNFLQVIRGCVESLGSRMDTQGRGERELEMIENTVQRGANLTRRLLTFGSKGESRRIPIDLNDRVRRAKTILDRTLPKTIETKTRLSEDIKVVDADPAQLEQVLLNLALNAKDSMLDGGLLRIETEPAGMDPSRLEASAPGEPQEWVLLRVSDTGHGMDDETLQHIFDPFFTTKGVGLGTGLGLAVVYGIVTDHGGQIGCTSEVGRGTVFEIRLPASSAESIAVTPEEAPEPEMGRGHEIILVVDDDANMLEVAREGLEQYGYVIHTADSGGKALEFFEEHGHAIDLVVLDLGMPGIGGRACLEKLLELRPDARIVVVTGFGTPEQEKEVREAGARAFLAKPYRIAELASQVRAALDA
jgi:CheY-like chemotaxis protein